eukprot:scaffold21854_cov190-Isochrysis_galbana.AAC.1
MVLFRGNRQQTSLVLVCPCTNALVKEARRRDGRKHGDAWDHVVHHEGACAFVAVLQLCTGRHSHTDVEKFLTDRRAAVAAGKAKAGPLHNHYAI